MACECRNSALSPSSECYERVDKGDTPLHYYVGSPEYLNNDYLCARVRCRPPAPPFLPPSHPPPHTPPPPPPPRSAGEILTQAEVLPFVAVGGVLVLGAIVVIFYYCNAERAAGVLIALNAVAILLLGRRIFNTAKDLGTLPRTADTTLPRAADAPVARNAPATRTATATASTRVTGASTVEKAATDVFGLVLWVVVVLLWVGCIVILAIQLV